MSSARAMRTIGFWCLMVTTFVGALVASARAAEPIKVGLVAALSGQSAKSGEGITRGFTAVSCSSQRMPSPPANVENAALSSAVSGAAAAWKWTRMKNPPVAGSPNWAESRMLQPRANKNPDTACTTPGRSGQASFKMNP